jgi:hypothetical protein
MERANNDRMPQKLVTARCITLLKAQLAERWRGSCLPDRMLVPECTQIALHLPQPTLSIPPCSDASPHSSRARPVRRNASEDRAMVSICATDDSSLDPQVCFLRSLIAPSSEPPPVHPDYRPDDLHCHAHNHRSLAFVRALLNSLLQPTSQSRPARTTSADLASEPLAAPEAASMVSAIPTRAASSPAVAHGSGPSSAGTRELCGGAPVIQSFFRTLEVRNAKAGNSTGLSQLRGLSALPRAAGAAVARVIVWALPSNRWALGPSMSERGIREAQRGRAPAQDASWAMFCRH